jgi:transposase
MLAAILEGIEKAIDYLEGQIEDAHARSDMNRLLARVPGVGKLIASVITASMPDPSVFRSGRDFAAWLGLTPRQNSSGGKQTLGGISKKGNRYIRKLLVLSATSLLRSVSKRKGALADWIRALLAKKPARLVTVALANKLARYLGDNGDRRNLPCRNIREGERTPPFLQAYPRSSCTDHSLKFGKRIETR